MEKNLKNWLKLGWQQWYFMYLAIFTVIGVIASIQIETMPEALILLIPAAGIAAVIGLGLVKHWKRYVVEITKEEEQP